MKIFNLMSYTAMLIIPFISNADQNITRRQKWRYQTGGYVESDPVIDTSGTLYIGSDDYKLYAILKTGELKWSFKTENFVQCTPILNRNESIVYITSYDTYLYAISTATGKLLWRYLVNTYGLSNVVVGNDGTVFVGSWDFFVYAISENNGELIWRYETDGRIESSPVIGDDGTLYVGSWDSNLHAVDTATGQMKWRYHTTGFIVSSPTIGPKGIIFVGSIDNYLYAVSSNGTLVWKFLTGGYIRASPVLSNNLKTVSVGSADSHVYSLTVETGLQLWSYPTGAAMMSSLLVATDGTLYFGSDDFSLYAISTEGILKWSLDTKGYVRTLPVLGEDGAVYLVSDSNLYAVSPNGVLRWQYEMGGFIHTRPYIDHDGIVYVGSDDGYIYAVEQHYGTSDAPTKHPTAKPTITFLPSTRPTGSPSLNAKMILPGVDKSGGDDSSFYSYTVLGGIIVGLILACLSCICFVYCTRKCITKECGNCFSKDDDVYCYYENAGFENKETFEYENQIFRTTTLDLRPPEVLPNVHLSTPQLSPLTAEQSGDEKVVTVDDFLSYQTV